MKTRIRHKVKLLPILIFVVSVVVMLGTYFISLGEFGFEVLYGISLASFIPYFIFYYLRINNPQIYFERKGYESAVIEYRYLLNTYYAVLVSLIFFLILFIISLLFIEASGSTDFIILKTFILTYGVLFPVFLCFESYRWRLSYDKEFNYYFANACFKIILEKEDTVQKIRYLILGISYYDKYLRENLQRRINNVEEIYSRILSDPTLDRDKTTELITEAFDTDDKLKAIACLSSILTDLKKEQFLVKAQFGRDLKVLLPILPVVISLLVPIIGILLKRIEFLLSTPRKQRAVFQSNIFLSPVIIIMISSNRIQILK